MKNRFENIQKQISEIYGGPVAPVAAPVPIKTGHVDPPKPRKRIQIVAVAILVTVTGCSSFKPFKGGKALSVPKPGGVAQAMAQSDNPSQVSRQEQETIRVRTYTLPAIPSSSSFSSSSALAAPKPREGGSSIPFSQANTPSLQNSTTPFCVVTDREETRAKTELGAAQKDTAREIGAKLSSLKGIVWVGVALFVFGVVSFVWPPLKFIIGSVTTSAAIILGGVALMVLPTLLVGHELLILGGVALTVGAWFLAHRHGRLHGELSTRVRLHRPFN